jgi:diadenosine tetraphosphatase ApaH/serine/threonine PP2A family protein phosphatase
MRIALFGDIHANLEALEAVLEDASKQEVTDYVCMGDIVGYNADPAACLEIVRQMECPTVKGNHDEDASGNHSLDSMNPVAAAALEWTRKQLSDEQRQWLMRLRMVRQVSDFTVVHSTHVPRVYMKTDKVQEITADSLVVEDGAKYFVNVGSVGQPRDGDWRACYAIYDLAHQMIVFRRVEYDIVKTQEKIIAAGLPPMLAERIQEGR